VTPEPTRALDVRLYDAVAGVLRAEANARLAFRYDDAWVARRGPALSYSLPVAGETYDDERCRPFFRNLLPEGLVREAVARRLGVAVGNDFALLAALGADCAGAVVLLPAGTTPADREPGVRWLDERQLEAAIEELPRRPLFAEPDDDIRLSLAGAQDKLVVVREADRIGVPTGGRPSTHILKAPLRDFAGSVENGAFCLRLAHRLGADTAVADVGRAGRHPYLLVRRFDRSAPDGRQQRLHQEDVCQALAVAPELKYQADGGPGVADVVDVLRAVAARPGRDLLALVDAVAVNFLVGNHDAHGKNFSVLHAPDGARLAPLYDVVSTAVLPGAEPQDGDARRRRVPAGLRAPASLGSARGVGRSRACGRAPPRPRPCPRGAGRSRRAPGPGGGRGLGPRRAR